MPYIKNLQVFVCPSDGGPTAGYPGFGQVGWSGPAISYAANSLCGGVGLTDNTPAGIVGLVMSDNGWASFFHDSAGTSQAAVTFPAQTIMLADHYSNDVQHTDFSWLGANTEDIWPINTLLWDCSPRGGDCYYQTGGSAVPDGAISSTVAYPSGPAGGVSTKHSGFANFAFSDGHVKAMRAEQTNPDGWNQPQNNMWVSNR